MKNKPLLNHLTQTQQTVHITDDKKSADAKLASPDSVFHMHNASKIYSMDEVNFVA